MDTLLNAIGRIARWLLITVLRLIGLALMILTLQYASLPPGDQRQAIALIVRDHHFDYVGWEVNALALKVATTLWGEHPFLDETARSARVRAYFDDLARAQGLENEVSTILTDPDADDSLADPLIAERDALRADLESRQPLIEAILEGQVAAVLVDLGFGAAGQLLPPIAMHFSQPPNALIISPRDDITIDIVMNIDPLPVDQIAALENRIDEAQEVSSIVVPIGGIALYPAMILETSSLAFALDTFAHEWLHHYLFFYPLGLGYDFAGETRIINETTASYFGREVGQLVLERYYPDLVVQPGVQRVAYAQDTFDFAAAMNETRVTVDQLLAEGQVAEAEAYMEERRQLFVANGYLIRKLNQAWFAFYGGYQTPDSGAGGGDPIGEAVGRVRERSTSLYAWIETMRTITTRAELLAAAGMEE